jgi:hypothetical protein
MKSLCEFYVVCDQIQSSCPKQFALRRKEGFMNELYAVIAVFVLIGLLVSRMKREERNVRLGARHSNPKNLVPVPETLKRFRDMPQGNLSSSIAADRELSLVGGEREQTSFPI